PWKYRKRQRSRIASGETASVRTRRKSSIESTPFEKKTEQKKEKEEKRASLSSMRTPRLPDTKLAPLISDVVSAASRETSRKDDFTTPPSRRLSLRLHSRDEGEVERKISIKSEPSDLGGLVGGQDSNKDDGMSVDVVHSNGFLSRSPISSRLCSPRIKKESREDEDWDVPGPSCSSNPPNGRYNGEHKGKLRRNGETKRENGIHRNSPSKLLSPSSSAQSNVSEESEIERHYREIGSRIVKMLVERGLIPSSTEHVYREIATGSVERDLAVSHEGKEDDDESDLVRFHSITFIREIVHLPSAGSLWR
ncbi:unnamed protein product, partial [Cylicostephanus goldi]